MYHVIGKKEIVTITENNVIAVCPECGKVFFVDLGDVQGKTITDEGASHLCPECSLNHIGKED